MFPCLDTGLTYFFNFVELLFSSVFDYLHLHLVTPLCPISLCISGCVHLTMNFVLDFWHIGVTEWVAFGSLILSPVDLH